MRHSYIRKPDGWGSDAKPRVWRPDYRFGRGEPDPSGYRRLWSTWNENRFGPVAYLLRRSRRDSEIVQSAVVFRPEGGARGVRTQCSRSRGPTNSGKVPTC